MKPIYLLTIAFCSFLVPVQAQQNRNDSTLMTRELTLEREYNPDIDNATKVNQLPELREPQAPKSRVEFSNYTTPYALEPELHLLPAQLYASEVNRVKKIGYATVGISSLVDVDADLGIQILNNSKNYLSIQGSHRSSNSKVKYLQIDEKQEMKINDNWAGINFIHDFEKFKLDLGAKYTYSAFNYYGVTALLDPVYYLSSAYPSLPITDYIEYTTSSLVNKDKNQVNNLFDIHAGITSSDTEDLSYFFNLSYKLFNQKYGLTEEIDGRKENQIKIGAGAAYKFNDDMSLGILGSFQNFSYSSIYEYYKNNSFGNQNYSLIKLNPYLHLDGLNWNLRVGAKLEFQTGGMEETVFAPDIHFRYQFNEQFDIDLAASGGFKENSNYNLFYENRYIDPAYRVMDSRTPLDFNLGLNFLILDNLKLKLFGGYEIIKDEHFCYTSPILPSAIYLAGQNMLPLYEDVNLFKVGFVADYLYQDIFEIKVAGTYNKWSEKEVKDGGLKFVPYGKPNFVGDLNIGYKLENLPIRIDAAYHLETGRKFFQTGEDTHSINDLSLKGNYTFNDTFSFYAKVNNLLFQKYEFWHGYPAQNFNIMGGISVKF